MIPCFSVAAVTVFPLIFLYCRNAARSRLFRGGAIPVRYHSRGHCDLYWPRCADGKAWKDSACHVNVYDELLICGGGDENGTARSEVLAHGADCDGIYTPYHLLSVSISGRRHG